MTRLSYTFKERGGERLVKKKKEHYYASAHPSKKKRSVKTFTHL